MIAKATMLYCKFRMIYNKHFSMKYDHDEECDMEMGWSIFFYFCFDQIDVDIPQSGNCGTQWLGGTWHMENESNSCLCFHEMYDCCWRSVLT